jgi:tRNA threonylcarbamoyladenosine biosynthesis protein TsaB
MYLVIDSSTKNGAVGLWEDGRLVQTLSWHSQHSHTAELMPSIDALLALKHRAVKDLTGIIVATGPGGFSALRAGMGAAKGLAFALSVPLAGVSTLEASAFPYRELGYPVCAMLESGRDSVAWARFQLTASGWHRRTPDRVTTLEEFLRSRSRHYLFCGEGLESFAGPLAKAMGTKAHLMAESVPLGRLQGAAVIGAHRLDVDDSDSVAALQPHYLRPPRITPPKPPHAIRLGAAAQR